MTDAQKEKKKAFKKLSFTAKLIIDRYEEKISGHEDYLSDRIKYTELAAAMHFTMITRYAHDKTEPIGDYVDAMGEARDFLEI